MSEVPAERSKVLGGTDAAAILGLSPWRSPMDVYCEKRGLTERSPETEAMMWGKLLEDEIAQEYRRRRVPSKKDFLRGMRVLHRDIPFIGGTPDFLVMPDGWGLEVKTANAFAAKGEEWGETGSDRVPVYYLLQCVQYMAILEVSRWDLAVLFGGQEYRDYTITRDLEIEEMLIDAECRFWKDHVEPGVPPPVDFARSDIAQQIAKRHPRDTEELRAATSEEIAMIETYRFFLDEESVAVKRAADVEYRIKLAIGDAAGLLFPDGGKITWKKCKDRILVDWESVAREMGNPPIEIVKKYSKQAHGVRVFRKSLK